MRYAPVVAAVLIFLAILSRIALTPTTAWLILGLLAIYLAASDILFYYATYIGFFTNRWWQGYSLVWVPEKGGEALYEAGELLLTHPQGASFGGYLTPLGEEYRVEVSGPDCRVLRPDASVVLTYTKHAPARYRRNGLWGVESHGTFLVASGPLEWCGLPGKQPRLFVSKGGLVGRVEKWEHSQEKMGIEFGVRNHLLLAEEVAALTFLLLRIDFFG